MYLLSRIFPGSEPDALEALEGRFRKVGFFEGSHEPVRLSSPDRFLYPADFEESENREPAPLGAERLESDPREFELPEAEPRGAALLEPEPLNSELPEAVPREVVLLESDPREDRLTAASRLDAEAPLDRSVVLPDARAGCRTEGSDFEYFFDEDRPEPPLEVPEAAFLTGPFLLEYVPVFFSEGFLPFPESELLILRFRQRY
jgi:hypothetical protein